MRAYILGILAVAAIVVYMVSGALSSSDAGDSMREGQGVSLADAGQYNKDTYQEVSGWLSELD